MRTVENDGSHVGVARSLYDAFGRGDVEALLGLVDPEVRWELVGPSEIPYFGVYRGVEEVRRFLGLLAEHCEVEEFELLTVTGTERGRFSGRPATYEMRWCHVLEIDDGLIASFTDHLDTAPMIEAWRS